MIRRESESEYQSRRLVLIPPTPINRERSMGRERQLMAGWRSHSTDADRPLNLYLRLLCHFQRVVDLDAQVPHSALQFRVTEQQLHDPQILGLSVDQRCLSTAHRVGSVRA